eukprot:scaffold282_cov121-Cylindrotheca_fusiformis.AAC.1
MAEAKKIDEENGDSLWMDAIRKEMKNIRVAFEEHEGDPNDLIGYQEITGHLVFDVKLGENFRRKARYCADGHKTAPPASVTYSTVVSRDSVRLMLLVAALNGLDVQGADIQNAYLNAPNREKVWIRAGPEFGDDEGKCFIVTKALYGLKSAGSSFRAFLAKKLDELGFYSCPADPDVWRRPATRSDGTEYYEYVLTYVDDLIAISVEARGILEEVAGHVKLKNDKIEPPENYLGAKLAFKYKDGIGRWTISSEDYVKAAIKTVEASLATKHKRFKMTFGDTPMTGSFVPELDGSPELDSEGTQFFQELIGILRWATELGRVDVLHEVSILSQYQAGPREGHLEQALRIFGFLKKHPKLTLWMDPELPKVDYGKFQTNPEDFKEMYRNAREELPFDMPVPRGAPVTITAYVDASHAANKVTRKSHSGFIIFVNRAPIQWYSKRQQTVESSAFSSEFIAMKVCLESIQALRYKLRMFGVPIMDDGPAHVFCDNEAVVKNCSRIESVLNKKHSSIAYHMARWCVAAKVATVAWIDGKENFADAMTKRLSKVVRERLFGGWTY